MQEIPFFASENVKMKMKDMLYLWACENSEYGYRQGINEILAMTIYAFFQEAISDEETPLESIDIEDIEVAKNMTNSQICNFIFNERVIFGDIYWCFERIMSFGMHTMFQMTKDMNVLKKEIVQELKSKSNEKTKSKKEKDLPEQQS